MKKILVITSLILTLGACTKAKWESYTPPQFVEQEPIPEPEPPEIVGDTVVVKILTVALQPATGTIPIVTARMERYGFIADSLGVDFILAREVDSASSTRSGGINRAAVLAEYAKMPEHVFFKGQVYQGGGYGIALYSRHAITKSLHRSLGDNRIMGLLEVQLPGDFPFIFAGAQLEDVLNRQDYRDRQAALLLSTTQPYVAPMAFAGNFFIQTESPASDPTFQILNQQFKPGCTTCEWTFPASATTNVIADFVMYKWPGEVKILDYKLINPPADVTRKIVYTEIQFVL